jgi:hypothetical protein
LIAEQHTATKPTLKQNQLLLQWSATTETYASKPISVSQMRDGVVDKMYQQIRKWIVHFLGLGAH